MWVPSATVVSGLSVSPWFPFSFPKAGASRICEIVGNAQPYNLQRNVQPGQCWSGSGLSLGDQTPYCPLLPLDVDSLWGLLAVPRPPLRGTSPPGLTVCPPASAQFSSQDTCALRGGPPCGSPVGNTRPRQRSLGSRSRVANKPHVNAPPQGTQHHSALFPKCQPEGHSSPGTREEEKSARKGIRAFREGGRTRGEALRPGRQTNIRAHSFAVLVKPHP